MIFPEVEAGGLVVRDAAGLPLNPDNVQNAYSPAAGYITNCPITALPSDCTARIEAKQVNNIVSELLSFAEYLDPDGPWNCNVLNNLALAHTSWWNAALAEVEIGNTTKVSKSGDVMTGYLTLNGNPLNPLHAAPKQYVDIAATDAASTKVSKAGDIMSGRLTLSADPADPLHAVTKQYTDALLSGAANGKVSKAGDIMTGLLTLSGDPTGPMHAVTKQYADVINAAVVGKVSRVGDTMSGQLTLAGDPSAPLHAVTKAYVDAFIVGGGSDKVSKTGDTMTGTLTVVGDSLEVAARAATTAGFALIEAQAFDYFSGPSFKGVSLRQHGPTAVGTTDSIPNANLSMLYAQNSSGLLIGGNTGQPIYFHSLSPVVMKNNLGVVGALSVGTLTPHVQFPLTVYNPTANSTAVFISGMASGATGGSSNSLLTSSLPIAADHRLGGQVFGYTDLTTPKNSAGVIAYSSQPWVAGTAQGSYLDLQTTPNNAITRATGLRQFPSGGVGIGAAAIALGADPGAGSLRVAQSVIANAIVGPLMNPYAALGSWDTSFNSTLPNSFVFAGDSSAQANAPSAGWWFTTNMRHSNAGVVYGRQDAWGWSENANKHFTRDVSAGVFGPWVQYLTSATVTNSWPKGALAHTSKKPNSVPGIGSSMIMAGTACSFTATGSGKVLIYYGGIMNASVPSTGNVQLRYGTGSAPGAGQVAQGTVLQDVVNYNAANGSSISFAMEALLDLVPGTPYWFDLSGSWNNAATGGLQGLSFIANELY